ncbi:MAG: hypothetical protein JWL73_2000 [Actinomycetia bacterium]|nr:hypothetical protein [Actinomycetes bacterium]
MTAALHGYDGIAGFHHPAAVEPRVTDTVFRRAWLEQHPVCPGCDGDLVETSRPAELVVERRYVCPDCWMRWRRDAAGPLSADGRRA